MCIFDKIFHSSYTLWMYSITLNVCLNCVTKHYCVTKTCMKLPFNILSPCVSILSVSVTVRFNKIFMLHICDLRFWEIVILKFSIFPLGLPRGVLPPVWALPGGDHTPGGCSPAARSGLLLPEQSTQAHHWEDTAGAVYWPQPELWWKVHTDKRYVAPWWISDINQASDT